MTANAKPIGMSAKILLKAYNAAFGLMLPLLRKNRRLQIGWEQRLAHELPGNCDLWLQAASGGEAYLAVAILQRLDAPGIKALVTTNTVQGLEILQKGLAGLEKIDVEACFCPFDKPELMQRYMAAVNPKLIVLLETELWPGMLYAAQLQNIPVLLANGRISPKSLKGYMRIKGFFRALAPQSIMAISADDAERFKTLFIKSAVSVMPNIKFDRIQAVAESVENPALAQYLPNDASFAVLGSVRKEEEDTVTGIIKDLRNANPQVVIGLYPRHMERVPHWRETLLRTGLPYVLRSELNDTLKPGTVLLGDTFGELGQAYQCARAVFVGGSLAKLGGQNFLEPLAAGVVPVIGPYWKNFAWVGREIIAAGLLQVENDGMAVSAALNVMLANPQDKADVKARFKEYIAQNLGGTQMVCDKILAYLHNN